MEDKGYIYKTTHIPTGVKYFGSRKLKDGMTPETDSYRGTPKKGSNLMANLFETRPDEEFSKEILFVGDYKGVIEMEILTIEEAWDKWGKVSEGGLVTNLRASKAVVNTDEVRAKMSAAASNRSAEHCANIGAALKGKRTGADNANAKPVTNAATGQIWPSVRDAAKSEGIAGSSMSERIRKGLKGGIWQYA
jgi:hypothetical protein